MHHIPFGVALSVFHNVPGQSFAIFVRRIWNPLHIPLEGIVSYCEPTSKCCPSCSILFCSTEYNTPTVFLLAGYLTAFQDLGHPFISNTDAMPFHANDQTLHLPISNLCSLVWLQQFGVQPFYTSATASDAILSDCYPTYHIPPIYWRD